MEKVVVTGMGAICSLGNNLKNIWENLLNGISGIGVITLFDPKDLSVKVAFEVKDFDPGNFIPAKEVRRRDRYQHFSAVAVKEALSQSGLIITEENAQRIGVVISTGIGGVGSLDSGIRKLIKKGPRKVNPFVIPMLMSNGASGLVGIDHGPKGPALSVSSACASGQDGIGIGWMMLRSGMIDVAIVGASEAPITKFSIAAFERIGAISSRGVDEHTPSPFDRNRDGLVIGEGAGVLVLENESHAKERGAGILAEIAGYSSTADAFHITAPQEDGLGGARAIQGALSMAGIDINEVDYINTHGTGTLLNDVAETRAIKNVFRDRAYAIPASSTKSMTGHMMSATGALETIICVQAINHNIIPPTINYIEPDPECDLDYVPNKARNANVRVALTNAFGFGGHNAVLVIKEYL
ncbi:MAG: beta-ketoacyl-ACP synthase II [Anaerolineales bacterium]